MRTGKKIGLNQNDASDHFLSAKRLHTRPTFGSNDRFLLLKPLHPSHGQTCSTKVAYLYLLMVGGYEQAVWPMLQAQTAPIASAKPLVRSHKPSRDIGTQLGALTFRSNKQ